MRDLLMPCGAVMMLAGCVAYSDASPLDQSDAGDAALPPPPLADAASTEVDAELDADAETPSEDAEPSPEPDAGVPPIVEATGDLRFARSATFDGYLTDRAGQPLYMFVNDTPGTIQSACVDACAQAWPPFDLALDVANLELAPGIDRNEVSRFHRQDGAWQLRYKGHALYYNATESGKTTVTADGADGRWFVARDYLAFLASPDGVLPVPDPTLAGRVLTDGFGRTLYVCFDDVPAGPGVAPVSSCTDDCLALRPPWVVQATNRTTVLPTVVAPTDLSSFMRPDGIVQLMYRGWPLYYFRDDTGLGALSGHNQRAWRAIDPVGFTGP